MRRRRFDRRGAGSRACTPPDLGISDYRLRELRTGAEAIAALRAEFGAALPALLITGDTAPQRLREARATGVPLLHKPVLPSELYRAMTRVLNGLDLSPFLRGARWASRR